MPAIRISARVEASVWQELKELADGSNRSVSRLLTEAIQEYIHRHRVRPVVLQHLQASIAKNERLGRLLAR